MQQLPFVVIGDGIAARILLFYLDRDNSDIPLVQISASNVFPACSRSTTSVNSLRGTTLGHSELGDLIVNSYAEFEFFFEKFHPAGVDKTREYQLWPVESRNHCKWLQRYPQSTSPVDSISLIDGKLQSPVYAAESTAYVITPEAYLEWLMPKRVQRITQAVIDVNPESHGVLVRTQSQTIRAAKCFICAGVFNQNFLNIIPDQSLKQRLLASRPVAGTYARIPLAWVKNKRVDLGKSFSLSLESANFIFRSEAQEFVLGATTENETQVYIPNRELFAPTYKQVSEFLWPYLELPAYESVQLDCGVRHKGQRRMPFWGKIADHTYMVSGLYKNAFTFAHLAATDLGRKASEDL